MGCVETRVEELAADKVRLSVDVPSADVRHAVEHAASDLAASLKIPGFRKGKVPMPVLVARVGKDRIYAEAGREPHRRLVPRRPSPARASGPRRAPEYDYELPDSAETPFSFTATVDVQPKVEVADWTTLEVGARERRGPAELVDRELDAAPRRRRRARARRGPARAARATSSSSTWSASRATRAATSSSSSARGRLVEELEHGLVGMSAGETKEIALRGRRRGRRPRP